MVEEDLANEIKPDKLVCINLLYWQFLISKDLIVRDAELLLISEACPCLGVGEAEAHHERPHTF